MIEASYFSSDFLSSIGRMYDLCSDFRRNEGFGGFFHNHESGKNLYFCFVQVLNNISDRWKWASKISLLHGASIIVLSYYCSLVCSIFTFSSYKNYIFFLRNDNGCRADKEAEDFENNCDGWLDTTVSFEFLTSSFCDTPRRRLKTEIK